MLQRQPSSALSIEAVNETTKARVGVNTALLCKLPLKTLRELDEILLNCPYVRKALLALHLAFPSTDIVRWTQEEEELEKKKKLKVEGGEELETRSRSRSRSSSSSSSSSSCSSCSSKEEE
jgi:hypothetical protein